MAAEIKANLETSAPEEWFQKVVDPTFGLVSGKAISADMQLAPNLELGFLNSVKKFADTQASCGDLGAGWHAPARLAALFELIFIFGLNLARLNAGRAFYKRDFTKLYALLKLDLGKMRPSL